MVGTSGIVSLPEIFSGGFVFRGLSHRIEGSYRGQVGWIWEQIVLWGGGGGSGGAMGEAGGLPFGVW